MAESINGNGHVNGDVVLNSRFTATEQRMLAVLSDGQRHRREELHACLWDNQGALSNIKMHLSNLRRKLRPKGQDIVTELYYGGIYIRQIRYLVSPNDGKR